MFSKNSMSPGNRKTTRAPGDEQRCVMVGGMTVILDVLCLLPHAEVVESRCGIEAHHWSFLSPEKIKFRPGAKTLICWEKKIPRNYSTIQCEYF